MGSARVSLVSVLTLPVPLAVGVREDFLRVDEVLRRPIRGERWVTGGEVIEPAEKQAVGAVGAVAAGHASLDAHRELVPFVDASPGRLVPAPRAVVGWGALIVFDDPLLGEVRALVRQRASLGDRAQPEALWAALADAFCEAHLVGVSRVGAGPCGDQVRGRRVHVRVVAAYVAGRELGESVRVARCVFERLISHLEQTKGLSLTLHEDYFFSMPFPESYDVTSGPPAPTIGQLTESWANVQRRQDDTISFELVWLADVLKTLGRLA